eukprot:COSAG01_NODE_20733_length_938_cov_0.949940_2_plen_178_part_00
MRSSVLHRLIPTTPWEAIWYGIGQWFDVADDQMGTVLPNLGSWNVGQTLFTSGMLFAGADMVAAPVPEPEPMPSSTDLTTGTLNGQCLGIWRLITPAGQSVPIPTCVIPDPSVLPAGVTTFISLAGDIVTIGSPNTHSVTGLSKSSPSLPLCSPSLVSLPLLSSSPSPLLFRHLKYP